MKYLSLLLVFLLTSTPTHSASNHLLKHIEALSRDYFYIDFSRDTSHYKHQTEVGGEHETHYFLLGFEADTFIIKIHSTDRDVGYAPRDDSYNILTEHWDEVKQLKVITVKVIGQQAWVDVSFSAHPFAQYSLEVERLDNLVR
ncbi:MAG: hypothetical protein ACJAT7_000660 [Psychromonas sp.]|jgi:hypothetical protein|uniref:hypothetical protein n=1 Tax=Psychromonas sp. TaxID=1884585 RepID=UPI0039E35027